MQSSEPIDVREMAILHQAFRRVYDEAARLVRANPVPSRGRVDFLADHIEFSLTLLHIHHEGEDELLYPKLIERAPEQALMTQDVEYEHELIKTALDAVSAACAAWRARSTAETGEALAASLDELNTTAQRHLDDEEQKVVPLAAVTVTQKEWDALNKHAAAEIPWAKRPIAFGMMLEPLSDADRAHMMRAVPAPLRMLTPLLLERPWKKYAATLRSDPMSRPVNCAGPG
jgi:hemerythrin-like domain-containing protein